MELEKGKWYKIKEYHDCIKDGYLKASFNGNYEKDNYGFTHRGEWCSTIKLWRNENYIPMTDQEVEEVLAKEAIRRGFVEGVVLEKSGINKNFIEFAPILGKFTYYPNRDILEPLGGFCGHVYEKGQWATIKSNKDMEETKDFIIPAEIVHELKEQGVELLFKKGWVWDANIEYAKENFVTVRRTFNPDFYQYITYDSFYSNFSETDPNKEQLEIGKLAYFWHDEEPKQVICSILIAINEHNDCSYRSECAYWRYCSHINPLIK